MNRRIRRYGLFAVTTLSLLSLRDAQADDFCADSDTTYDLRASSVTRSLAAGVLHPVKGDERFFDAAAVSGPTTPSSIMFLLDNSGSMMWFPQCTSGWNSYNSPCSVPSLDDPDQPSSANSYAPVVRARSDFSGTRLAWMAAIEPVETYADPGYDDGAGYLKDAPPWTPTPQGTCDASTQDCLFEKDKAYQVESWDETSATPEPGDGCSKYDSNGTVDKDHYGNEITAGEDCRTKLSSEGFYQYKVRYVSGVDRWGRRQYSVYSRFVVSGKWLNANPPKFVSARRAIKQLLRIDPVNPKSRDNVRYGLSTFWSNTATGADLCGSGNNVSGQCDGTTGYRQGDGATLLVPLGPDCTHTDRANHVASRQIILNAINGTGSNLLYFSHSTPLAESLFNVAQYFSVQGSGGDHELRFGTTWTKSGTPAGISYWAGQDFRQCSSGVVGASWAGCNADGSNKNPDQRSVCWSCQVSAAIVVTDGMPTSDEAVPSRGSSHVMQPKIPEGDAASPLTDAWGIKTWQPTAYSTACGANRGAYGDKCGGSYLPLVAYYLNQYDQVPESTMEGKQNVLVHTISFGLADGTAKTMLQATANLGGGRFADTSDSKQLEDALTKAVNNVVARQTAFSSANSNALQTNRNQATETYFARFKPSTAPPQWEGHLAQAILFDEFAMGCDPTKPKEDTTTVPCGKVQHSPNFNGDALDGKNVCDGIFLVDQNCQEITESSSDGSFVLVDDPDKSADLPWDAGKVLCNPNGAYLGTPVPCTALHASFVSAADDAAKVTATGKPLRKVYTYLGPKVGLVEFKTTDAATLTALRKAMSLDQPFCDSLLRATSGCVGGVCRSPPNLNTDDMNQCAKLLIYYVRGFDVFDIDADGCRSPVNSAATCATASVGEERMWKLGDIFHSTPAVVKPPPHPEICDTGYDSQCAATIYSPLWLEGATPQTEIDRSADGNAYEVWRKEQIDRKRVVLAGANDGMLHAFDAGSPISTAKRDPYGSAPYDSGTGKELWAFIPPDLLPRLKLMIDRHQYMVDGPTMVRDVWVDGGSDGKGTKDRVKQKEEFHTVAILSERSGGSQFVALDVTNPESPKFLWSFPEPNSEDARWMAESWADFAPRPPPIGPVRIAAEKSLSPRGFDELWVVMLNGGYDPAMVKGRAVFMVDVWTGKTVWRFTDDDVKEMKGATSGAGMFPVAASVAMVDVGDPLRSNFDRDGFFDTATWGDLGGNLWVARFHDPGTLTDGLVTDWYAGRAFEQQRQGTDDVMSVNAGSFNASSLGQVRSPFFHMTANTWEVQTRTLRTFLGSGNREQILQKGRECNPDNVWGCIQAGCSDVIVQTKDEFGGCTQTQRLDYVSGTFSYSSTDGCGTTGPVCGGAPGNAFKTTTTYDITCGGTKHPTITGTMTCNALGECSQYTEVGTNPLTGGLAAPTFRDRFYGIWSYGGPDQKLFSTQAGAKTFDENRFTDVDYSGTCGGGLDGKACRLVDVTWAKVTYDPSNPAATLVTEECPEDHKPCIAKATDPGWFYEYGQVCQDASCTKTWNDERTASPANVVLGCAAWNGFRPTGSGTAAPATDVCRAAPAETSSYSYLADFITGLPSASCGFANNGVIYRSFERNTWSPPSAAMARVSFNQRGQVSYSTLNLDPGAPPSHTTIGVQEVGADQVYELEVTREAHECRHVSNASCK